MRLSTATRVDRLPLLVTRATLTTAGVDLDVALRAVRSGHWKEVLPGAWLRRDLEVTHDHRQQAARTAGGRAAPRLGEPAPDHR